MGYIQREKDKRNNPTILKIPDKLWDEIRKILPKEKSSKTIGRPIVKYRILDDILYILTGCQWKMLPSRYGSIPFSLCVQTLLKFFLYILEIHSLCTYTNWYSSTCHRRFLKEWIR